MKTLNEIRQCDIFSHTVIEALQKKEPINLKVDYNDDSYCVVVTQDCDIVHEKQDEEPFVEFIICGLTNDKSYKNGKNPRKLHLENGNKIFEFNIYNRFFVKKELLIEYKFTDASDQLTDDNKKILKKWLGNRYIRAAFPDAFNERFSQLGKKIDVFLKKSLSEKVSHIFFEVEDKELPKDEVYELNVVVVVDTENDDEKSEICNAYEDLFGRIEGINSYVRVETEDGFTLKDLRRYKRWDKDSISFSKPNHSFPVEGLDLV